MSRRHRLRSVVCEVARRLGPPDWRRLRGTSNQGKCDPEVYQRGSHIFTTHTLSAAMIETWVRRVRRKAPGARIDWHYVGGRACILALDDLEQARRALLKCRGMHDAMYVAAMSSMFSVESSRRSLEGLWSQLAVPTA